ncbi:hypothetical protein GTS_55490 [Gandjariella thermophila]|uniref:Uncharacterized protein n=1 Tax=Gandjariella thermophila TaxID=1931992 RepID=A0A4D4JHP2_9PSEU|nr:hypothetical protein GTS_55490 [Gandjariella thermophila]
MAAGARAMGDPKRPATRDAVAGRKAVDDLRAVPVGRIRRSSRVQRDAAAAGARHEQGVNRVGAEAFQQAAQERVVDAAHQRRGTLGWTSSPSRSASTA